MAEHDDTSTASEHFFIESTVLLCHGIPRKQLGMPSTRRRRRAAAFEDSLEPSRELVRIARCDHDRILESRHCVNESIDVADDHRRANCQRLEHRQAEALQRHGRNDRDVGRPIPIGKVLVLYSTDEPHRRIELERQRLETISLRTDAHQRQDDSATCAQLRSRLDRHFETHPVPQPTYRDYHADVLPQAQGTTSFGTRRRGESHEIDPWRDASNPRRRDPVSLDDKPLEGMRQHDDPARSSIHGALHPALKSDVDVVATLGSTLIGPWTLEVDNPRPATSPP